MTQEVTIVDKIKTELIDDCNHRHRLIVGGRGKGASWGIARILLLEGMLDPLFIVCVREVQKSIQHSVQKLLADTIKHFEWEWFYKVTKTSIVGTNGTEFVFYGLHDHNADSIKSLEGADRCWVAEAQSISRLSIDILRPTIRKENAVFWWDFNPRYSTDPVYIDYIRNNDASAKVLWLSYLDNPWFPTSLEQERLADYKRDPVRAKHIWEGALADANENYVCPLKLVDEAMHRNLLRVKPDVPIIGADIAHQGGDEIVFVKRIREKVTEWYVATYQNTITTLTDLKNFAGKNSIINIDNGHLGAAVADLLEDDGYTVQRISFGGTPKDKKHYEDVATEMYFDFRDILEIIDIPFDEQLNIELTTRKYDYINGKRGYEVMKIESKEDWAKHTHAANKSPGRADAIVMAYYNIDNTFNISNISGAISAYGGR